MEVSLDPALSELLDPEQSAFDAWGIWDELGDTATFTNPNPENPFEEQPNATAETEGAEDEEESMQMTADEILRLENRRFEASFPEGRRLQQLMQDDIALSSERVYAECEKEYISMFYNPQYQEMNQTVMKNCRVRVENKLQGCCNTVRFKEWGEKSMALKDEIVEGCSGCSVSCEHFYFAQFCDQFFGQACKVKRKPLSDLDFEIIETFCIPQACLNDHDRKGILSFFDIRYRRLRSGWRYNFRENDAELICPDGMMENILIAGGALVFVIFMIFLILFLFKPPAESKKQQSRRREKPAS